VLVVSLALEQRLLGREEFISAGVGCRSLVVGCWLLVVGHWSLVVGSWSLVAGRWSLAVGRWSLLVRLMSGVMVVQSRRFCRCGFFPRGVTRCCDVLFVQRRSTGGKNEDQC
jgi:hypothetical protein